MSRATDLEYSKEQNAPFTLGMEATKCNLAFLKCKCGDTLVLMVILVTLVAGS